MYAEQVKTVPAGDALAPEINLTGQAVVQLVHDLRHQLAVMTLCVNAIRDSETHDRADRLAELRRSAELAVLLIDALLTNERPHPSTRAPVDVNEVVRSTVAMLSHFHGVIRFQLDLWAEPLRVLTEPGDLERVLLNLLLNACDAMPDGGVLAIDTTVAHFVRLSEGMPPRSYARLTVRDTGCGMTAEVKDRIFGASFTTKKKGTGLGLRSVAFTIQQLQGQVSVESEPGRGTSVTVMLPLTTDASVWSVPAIADPHDPRD